MNDIQKFLDRFIKYLEKEKHYPETTVTSYNRDLLSYIDFISKNKIDYKKTYSNPLCANCLAYGVAVIVYFYLSYCYSDLSPINSE